MWVGPGTWLRVRQVGFWARPGTPMLRFSGWRSAQGAIAAPRSQGPGSRPPAGICKP